MTERVGQYELVRRIGSGGMAEVWMGRRASVGGAQKSVAIKFMSARVAADERHRRMFLAEARLSMLMTHSNVVQVFDAGEDAGRLYLVMEWIDGLNLAQLLELQRREGRPWAPRITGYVIGEVLRALAYAHHLTHEGQTLSIVHRDISPHNVLVSTSGEVKLADFGVARLNTEETSGIHIKGKLRYMAPEHLAGRSREPTVDLYGVGAVLHELLSGARFRDEADEVDLYGQILGGYLPPLSVPGVPPELASLREGLLQADPRQRIPTATRALEYLAAWAGYRNASIELGQLCRSAMGVVAPRSGIESAPTQRAAQAGGEGASPTGATHTADGAVTRTSGAMPAVSRTSGAMPAGTGVLPSAQPTMARPLAKAGGRASGRRALLIGAGVLGVGFSLGGIAVAVLRSKREERPDDPPASGGGEPRVAEAGQGSAAEVGAVAGGEASASAGVGGPSSAGAEDGRVNGAAGSAGATEGSANGAADPGSAGDAPANGTAGPGSAGDAPANGAAGSAVPETAETTGPAELDEPTGEPAPEAPAAPTPERRKPSAPAILELSLRSPLRVAYVRLGRKGSITAVEPKAERQVTAGRHSIWWRKSPSDSWIDGGSFAFAAGRRYKVRLSPSGVEVE